MFPFSKKRRNNPQRQRTPSWVIWIVVAFITYAMLTNNKNSPTTAPNGNIKSDTDASPSEITAEKPKTTHPLLGSIVDPEKMLDIGLLKGKLTPQAVMRLRVKDSEKGSGQFAICGQKVTISYDSFAVDRDEKKTIEKDKTVAFQIGENKVMPALEVGVVGMRKNGIRTIFSSADMAYSSEKFARSDVATGKDINFEVKMLDITPQLPDISAYRVLGDGYGTTKGYSCGSEVKLHVALWDMEGKKLYSSRDNNGSPITFTLGKSEVFLGLEQGVLDMLPKMKRNLIVPPSFQKTLLGNQPSINFPLPKNQIVLVDVEAVE